MKTLDDVIEAMERCSAPYYINCKGCPYEGDNDEVGCRSDDRDVHVLHFLKELRYILDNLIWVKPEEKGHWEIQSLLPENDERTERGGFAWRNLNNRKSKS